MTDQRLVTEVIPSALSGQRIDRVVALATGVSRSRAAALIESGMVTIGGRKPDKPSQRVEENDLVEIELDEEASTLVPDPEVPITIVHADDDIVVVDKAAGIVVHPGSGVTEGTLVQGLMSRFPSLIDLAERLDDQERPGIVHRIDRGTSGLLVVALTEDAYRNLVGQFSRRTVKRRYRALVVGHVESDGGMIDAPLGRSPRDRTRRAVVADGKPARTHYRVAARYREPVCTLVDCRLETGRTHQIRAHFAAIDHPVVGDDRYRGSRLGLSLDRPFLHAAELGFVHPRTGEALDFSSPLPDDLATVLDRLSAEAV